MNRTIRREGKRQVFKEMKSLGWTEFREVGNAAPTRRYKTCGKCNRSKV